MRSCNVDLADATDGGLFEMCTAESAGAVQTPKRGTRREGRAEVKYVKRHEGDDLTSA